MHELPMIQDVNCKVVSLVAGHDVGLDCEVSCILTKLLLRLHFCQFLVVESAGETCNHLRFEWIVALGLILAKSRTNNMLVRHTSPQ